MSDVTSESNTAWLTDLPILRRLLWSRHDSVIHYTCMLYSHVIIIIIKKEVRVTNVTGSWLCNFHQSPAFLIIVSVLSWQMLKSRVVRRVRCLVVVPVGDLAAQVHRVFSDYCRHTELRVGLSCKFSSQFFFLCMATCVVVFWSVSLSASALNKVIIIDWLIN